jgi:hypothetical protein
MSLYDPEPSPEWKTLCVLEGRLAESALYEARKTPERTRAFRDDLAAMMRHLRDVTAEAGRARDSGTPARAPHFIFSCMLLCDEPPDFAPGLSDDMPRPARHLAAALSALGITGKAEMTKAWPGGILPSEHASEEQIKTALGKASGGTLLVMEAFRFGYGGGNPHQMRQRADELIALLDRVPAGTSVILTDNASSCDRFLAANPDFAAKFAWQVDFSGTADRKLRNEAALSADTRRRRLDAMKSARDAANPRGPKGP